MRHGVILLPGIITPASIAYAPLLRELGGEVRAQATELAVYAAAEPPKDYTLADEVASVEQAALAAGFDRFHLVGYSGGGAIAATYASGHPDRVVSLTLMEAAWLGNAGASAMEAEARRRIEEASRLPPQQAIPLFTKLQLAPDVTPPPPPPGDPPLWMAQRPVGIAAINRAFRDAEIEADDLRGFDPPTLYILGGKSSSDFHGEIARRAERLFPNFHLEIFPQRHHFDPPHRSEPDKVAQLLLQFWTEAEATASD